MDIALKDYLGEPEELVRRCRDGEARALEELFERHTARLHRMVRARLDWRMQGRVSEADVVQEVYLEASRRLPDYLAEPKVPFFVWLRFLTGQKLVDLQRRHLGVKARDARREVPLLRVVAPGATSKVLAEQLLNACSTPSQKVARAELKALIQDALDSLSPGDREVLVLKHYENLTNVEIAHELGIQESAASKRYLRALTRVRKALVALPGGGDELWTKSL